MAVITSQWWRRLVNGKAWCVDSAKTVWLNCVTLPERSKISTFTSLYVTLFTVAYLKAVTRYLADKDLAASCRWRLICRPVRWWTILALSILLHQRVPGACQQRQYSRLVLRSSHRSVGSRWRRGTGRRWRLRSVSGHRWYADCRPETADSERSHTSERVGRVSGPRRRTAGLGTNVAAFTYLTRDRRRDVMQWGRLQVCRVTTRAPWSAMVKT